MTRLLCALLLILGARSHAAPATEAGAPVPEYFAAIQDRPGLPRVLLIGDSISVGYTLPVRELLRGKANVHRIPVNGGPSSRGVKSADEWLGAGHWDVIHFNFGIHDLKLMPDGKRQVEPADYEANLRAIVAKLAATGARLIWATITPIPEGADKPAFAFRQVAEYNAIALRVMAESHAAIDDLNALVAPRLGELQIPDDVHFKPDAYPVLARQVAASIEQALLTPK